jgi:DNA-binding transcriptional LysR family regulator
MDPETMTLDLRKLEHALAVERARSFTIAAEELRLTQSTLSRSIASLEAAWGVRVFERDQSGVVPTALGQEFLREAARLVAESNALDHHMKLRGKAPSGSVAFGLGPFLGELILAEILSHISHSSPSLRVEVSISSPVDLISRTANGQLDFAVMGSRNDPEGAGVVSTFLCEAPMSFIMRPDHPLTSQRVITPHLVGQTPVLVNLMHSPSPFDFSQVVSCDDMTLCKKLIRNSDLIWLVSPWVVRREIAAGDLCQRAPAGEMSSKVSGFWLISRPDAEKSGAVEMLVNAVHAVTARAVYGEPKSPDFALGT